MATKDTVATCSIHRVVSTCSNDLRDIVIAAEEEKQAIAALTVDIYREKVAVYESHRRGAAQEANRYPLLTPNTVTIPSFS